MTRRSWEAARLRAQTASFDYYKERLTIRCGQTTITDVYGVLDTGIDELDSTLGAMTADGTFPVFAKLSVWRSDLGFVPNKDEQIYIKRSAYPEQERLYLVHTVDDQNDLLNIELQAQQYNGRPYQF